jgi:hypothetical protein
MPHWLLTLVRWPWTLIQRVWRWIKVKAADRQAVVSSGASVVADVQEFLGRATPLAVSIEERPGEITARLNDLNQEWNSLRGRLRTYTNGHSSIKVRRLGPELIENVQKLMLGLRYMANKFTDPKEKAAAYQSVSDRHAKAVALTDDLLNQVHRS